MVLSNIDATGCVVNKKKKIFMVLFRKNRFLKLTGKAHRGHRQSAAIGLKLKDILMKPWSSYHMAGKIVASASLYISLICRF